MNTDKNEFLRSIRGQRHEDFAKQMKEYEQRLQIARQQRLEQLRQEYVEKKKQDFRRDRALKKQQKVEDKKRRLEAEEKRKEQERLAEKRKKLEEQTRKQRERDEEIEKRLQAERETTHATSSTSMSGNTSNRRGGPPSNNYPQDKDKTDSRPWRRQPRENDENQSTHDAFENRRPQTNIDRRPDDSTTNRSIPNESWRSKTRSDQQNRDDRRGGTGGASSSQQPTSERWPERNAETSDNWRTVEKKRPNPPRTSNDRPPQHRSDEGASSGPWRPKQRTGNDQSNDQRGGDANRGNGGGGGQQSADNRGRAEGGNSWRIRTKAPGDSWRSNDDNENEDDRRQQSSTGGSSFDNRRRQNQN